MREDPCCERLSRQRLLAYWLDESIEDAAAIEEHLFGCASCSESLARLVELGDAIRRELIGGDVAAILPNAFVERLKSAGLRIREYRPERGQSVNCTVTVDDDLVLAHLRAPLEHVTRLDAVVTDRAAGSETRLADIGFNAQDGEIVLLPATSQLRPVQQATQTVQLIAVDERGETILGNYVFEHRAT